MPAPVHASAPTVRSEAESAALARRAGREWLVLVLVMGLLVLALVASHLRRLDSAEQAEVDRLTVSTRVLGLNLAEKLRSAQARLRLLREDIATDVLPTGYLPAQLRSLRRAWPGARRIDWIDASGRVAASSEEDGLGRDVSQTGAFVAAASPAPGARPDRLIVEHSAATPLRELLLAMPLPAPPGQARGGLVQATFEPANFVALLQSVNETPEAWSALVRGNGRLLLIAPRTVPETAPGSASGPTAGQASGQAGAPGFAPAGLDAALARHLQSRQQLSVHPMPAMPGETRRMLVLRSVDDADLSLDGQLLLASSSSLDTAFARVGSQTALYAALLALAGLAAGAALRLLHRWRAAQAAARIAQLAQADFLELALRGGNLGLWESDLRTGAGQANERWHEMLGLRRGDLPSDTPTWQSLIHPEDRDRVVAAQEAHIRGETPAFEQRYRLRHSDGHWVWVLDRARVVQRAADGQPLRMAGTHLDITESVLREQALREREHQLSTICDALPGPVLQVDREHRILFVNAAFERWNGISTTAVLGQRLSDIMSPQAMESIAPYLERVHDGQTVEFAQRIHERGFEREVFVTLVPDREPGGGVRGHFAVLADVTESRRTDRHLQTVRDELAATLAAVPDLLFDVDLEGRIYSQHSPRHDLLAADSEAIIGQRMDSFIPAEAAAVVSTALMQAHEQGYSGGLQYELPLQGGTRWFELSVSRKALPAGRAGQLPRFIVLARDITERKQAESERRMLERQLREVQKMESIGTLAGGIAHDFNNILAAILGNVALAGDDLPDGHPARSSLEQIRKASLRARSLVQQILTFSRRAPQQLGVQPLRPVLEETLALLRATLPAGVQLRTQLSDEPLRVRAEPTQLQQVLMNLCTNAWQALPEGGGSIEVGLAPCEARDLPALDAAALFEPRAAPRGPHAHIWVADNGLGMDAALRERIFDPFFTTKPVGQGTGLGLSVVHGIVRGHGGGITVDSRPGEGSVFHVWLPLAEEDASAAPVVQALPAPGPPAAAQGQSVLVVDDDEVMLVMVQRLLQRAGYRVTTCAGAAEALACVQATQPPFDALVSDFNMPGMSGLELARQLQQRAPGLPVLISSGYLSEELQAQAGAAGVRGLMKKENTLEELTGLLQQVLAGQR